MTVSTVRRDLVKLNLAKLKKLWNHRRFHQHSKIKFKNYNRGKNNNLLIYHLMLQVNTKIIFEIKISCQAKKTHISP